MAAHKKTKTAKKITHHKMKVPASATKDAWMHKAQAKGQK